MMEDLFLNVVLAAAENEEFVPPDDWRGAIALPAGIIIFLGSVFLLLRSNLGTRRAYLVEASAFFGFMTILSLFWAFGAPGTPQFTGPQNLPGQPADFYLPKWIAFASDSTVADEQYPVVKQFPEGFEQEAVGGEEAVAEDGEVGSAADEADVAAAGDAAAGGADEIGNFFREQRGGVQPIGDEWVQDGPPLVTFTDAGEKIVASTYAKPFALNDDGEVPTGPDGQPLFAEDQIGQPIPEDFTVPSGLEDDAAQLVAPERFTGFAVFEPGFPLFPSLVMIVLSIAGLVIHALLLAWDENREREETVEEVVVEREPVGASR